MLSNWLPLSLRRSECLLVFFISLTSSDERDRPSLGGFPGRIKYVPLEAYLVPHLFRNFHCDAEEFHLH